MPVMYVLYISYALAWRNYSGIGRCDLSCEEIYTS